MNKKNLTKEITSKYSFLEEFLSYLPNPIEAFLSQSDDMFSTFAEMLFDSHISAKLEQLKDEVLSKEWYIEPFDNSEKASQIAKFVEDALSKMNIEESLSDILSAVEYGYSVSEIIWELKDGIWIPSSIKTRQPELFKIKPDETIIYHSSEGDKEINPTYKIILFKHKPSPSMHYGTPVLASCYWPWMFKKAGYRFWLTVAEKFGVPTVLAIFNTEGLSEDEVKERADFIAEALSNIQSDAALAIPDIQATVIESKGSANDFYTLIEACNAEISKAITGEQLTSDKGNTGSYALAKIHLQTLKQRGRKLAKSLANTLTNTLVKWIVELNFGKDAPVPYFNFDFSEIADWDQVKDAIDRGIPISKEAIYQQYNIPEPKDDSDSFISPKLNPSSGGESFSDFFTQMLTRMNLR